MITNPFSLLKLPDYDWELGEYRGSTEFYSSMATFVVPRMKKDDFLVKTELVNRKKINLMQFCVFSVYGWLTSNDILAYQEYDMLVDQCDNYKLRDVGMKFDIVDIMVLKNRYSSGVGDCHLIRFHNKDDIMAVKLILS